jgi:hypothetical protein
MAAGTLLPPTTPAAPAVHTSAAGRPDSPDSRGYAMRVAVLLALPVLLALARLWLGPWYHTWNPQEVNLLEGLPAAWEVSYYTDQFPNFLGNAPPRFGVAPVHYRTFSTLYLATVLYGWTGSAHFAFAAVDVLFWGLAGIATYHLALRLRVTDLTPTSSPYRRGELTTQTLRQETGGRRPVSREHEAMLAAVLVVTSPLFISHMWRHDLHAANFASMVIGAWAAVALVDGRLRPALLAAALGAVLVLLGLNYSYQWISMPLIGVLCLTSGTTAHQAAGWRGRLLAGWTGGRYPLPVAVGVTLGAIAVYFAGTRALEWLFATLVASPAAWTSQASEPGSLILDRLRAVRTPLDLLGLFGTRYLLQILIDSYSPLVLAAGIAGSLLHSRRLALLTLAGLAVSLFSLGSYPAPWAATIAYPYVYLGAAHTAIVAGRLVGHVVSRLSRLSHASRVSAGSGGSQQPWRPWLSRGTVALLAAAMIVPTNLDLLGNTSFLLRWWAYFAGRYLF